MSTVGIASFSKLAVRQARETTSPPMDPRCRSYTGTIFVARHASTDAHGVGSGWPWHGRAQVLRPVSHRNLGRAVATVGRSCWLNRSAGALAQQNVRREDEHEEKYRLQYGGTTASGTSVIYLYRLQAHWRCMHRESPCLVITIIPFASRL